MKKLIKGTICMAMGVLSLGSYAQKPSDTPQSQMEKLDRGLVVINYAGGSFVSWRLLGTDDEQTTFEVLKNGASVAKDIYKTTSVNLAKGDAGDTYQVVTYQNGVAVETSPAVSAFNKGYYHELKLDKPGG